MYLRKITVCNVNTFSYNRGTPGGALYLGNIGSPKDRCVSNTELPEMSLFWFKVVFGIFLKSGIIDWSKTFPIGLVPFSHKFL